MTCRDQRRILARRSAPRVFACLGVAAAALAAATSGYAQVQAPFSSTISRTETAPPRAIAQVSPGVIPTDVTPVGITRERSLFMPDVRFKLFQKLPARLWFNATTECDLRYESNVFQTSRKPLGDVIFRILPNVTAGWNVGDATSLYCNYFMIKDIYGNYTSLNFPTTQSVSMGARHDFMIGRRTDLQLDFQARELWQTAGIRQADLLPALNLTRVVGTNTVLFASAVLQMRSGEFFQGATRELDPFYSIGAVWRRGKWTFVATDTLVTNFRSPPFNFSVPMQGNNSMVADFEVFRPVSDKVPGLVTFVRAEPIWNWNSNRLPGLSGFDFRIFGGLRLSLSKPAYSASINQLRKQLKEAEEEDEKDGKRKGS